MGKCLFPQSFRGVGSLVPCNKCLECRKSYVSSWSFRLMQEERVSNSSHFITLTYDDSTVPVTKNGFLGLKARDLELFFKRLRRAHESPYGVEAGGEIIRRWNGIPFSFSQDVKSIKYYAVGEYGSRTKRPHYHIILFNADIELIEAAWDKGNVFYGNVSGASVGYTLKYLCKPRYNFSRNDDREREFGRMSKGLGESYLLDRNNVNWHRADVYERMYVNCEGGIKAGIPRYYKDRMYHDFEKYQGRVNMEAEHKEKMNERWCRHSKKEYKATVQYKNHSMILLDRFSSFAKDKI